MISGGQSWADFVRELFRYETCDVCGGGEDDHVPAVVLGHWFAFCVTQCPGCPEPNRVPFDGDTPGHCPSHWHQGRADDYEGHS